MIAGKQVAKVKVFLRFVYEPNQPGKQYFHGFLKLIFLFVLNFFEITNLGMNNPAFIPKFCKNGMKKTGHFTTTFLQLSLLFSLMYSFS